MKRMKQTEIEVVFNQHYKEFCLLSYSYLGCMDNAQDIVQDAFVKILADNKCDNILNLKAYIWIAVRNASLKYLKRSAITEPIGQQTMMLSLEEETPIDEHLGVKIQQAIDKLPPQCKNVFKLCAIEGHKYDAAADFLGISVNTVKTQMKKAYKVLRHDLKNLPFITLFFLLNQ